MKRVNVRIRPARSDRVHRAFTVKPNGAGEDRRTYCSLGARNEGDTEDPVTCIKCLRQAARLEFWPLEEDRQTTTEGGPLPT